MDREGLRTSVRLLVPVLPVPTFGLLPRVSFPLAESPDFLVLIELSVREVLPRLIRLLGLLVAALDAVEPDGLLVLIELPMSEVLLRLIWLRVLVVGDFPVLEREDAKLLALKELPVPEVLLRLIRLLELLVDDPLALIVLPMREVLLRLIWLRELVVGDFTALEREDAKLLALKELPEDLRALEEFEGRDTLDRLDVLLPEELLRVTLELLLVEGLEVLTLELEELEYTEVL